MGECAAIEDKKMEKTCEDHQYYIQAQAQKDREICEEISEYVQRVACLVNVHANLAIDTSDVHSCEILKSLKVESPIEKEPIPNEVLVQVCYNTYYSTLAKTMQDATYCNQLTNEDQEKNCKEELELDTEMQRIIPQEVSQ